jgi:hypothetical protein
MGRPSAAAEFCSSRKDSAEGRGVSFKMRPYRESISQFAIALTSEGGQHVLPRLKVGELEAAVVICFSVSR